ncbi:hypothetical protein NFI96_014098, partial [Prochilodus magdalenae]
NTLVSVCGRMTRTDLYIPQVSLELNPGWPNSTVPPGFDLLHVRALGGSDTLHLLLCSKGAPAVLLVHTNSTESSVQVDWAAFLSAKPAGSLRVVPESSVEYSSALVLTRLLEYDDVNNTADPQDFLPPYDLWDFSWSDLNHTLNHTLHTALLCGRDGSPSFINGSLCLDFAAFESEGREEAWPRLLHNANSSQLRVYLEDVIPRANQSRFVLELQTVSQWVSSPVNSSSVRGFTQWKPVAYRKLVPVLEDATPCRNSPPVSLSQLPTSGLVLAYFTPNALTSGLNISFGIAGNAFYNSTGFLSWTVLTGMGTPPLDSFSALVIGIMAVGLCTPLALIIVGGVYVCIRKRREQHGYQPIN